MSNLLQRRSAPAALLPGPGTRPAPARAAWQGVFASLAHWLHEQRERRGSIARLKHLNDWMLRDIGIDRDDIEGSVDRSLWELRVQRASLTDRGSHRGL